MIAIVDYDTGNICSVTNALKRVGCTDWVYTDDKEILIKADKVILPGVGEASTAMAKLAERGLDTFIPTLTQPVLGICVGTQLMCQSSEEGNVDCMGIFRTKVKKFQTHPNGSQTRLLGADKPAAVATYDKPRAEISSLNLCRGAEKENCKLTDALSHRPCEGGNSVIAHQSPLPCREGWGGSPKVPHMGWNQITDLRTPLFKDVDEGAYIYYVHSFYPELCEDTIATTQYINAFSGALGRDNFFGTQFHPEKSGAVGAQIIKNFLEL